MTTTHPAFVRLAHALRGENFVALGFYRHPGNADSRPPSIRLLVENDDETIVLLMDQVVYGLWLFRTNAPHEFAEIVADYQNGVSFTSHIDQFAPSAIRMAELATTVMSHRLHESLPSL